MLFRALPRRCLVLRALHTQAPPSLPSRRLYAPSTSAHAPRILPSQLPTHRAFSTTSSRHIADQALVEQKMEEITDLYGTARDEFEIAAEETLKKTVYAADDRAAAREELEKLKEAYRVVVDGEDKGVAEEVKRRVGGRVRELEKAVEAMEEAALEE